MLNNEEVQDTLKDLTVTMNLRKPQEEALYILAEVVEALSWEKTTSPEQLATELENLRQNPKLLTLTSFERQFPSVTFSLATGVGKTRLMAASIAYLHRTRGVNNFFVIAPNKTIYEKLKVDFSPKNPQKYVFTGLYDFVTPPRIIDGDNFEEFRQVSLDGVDEITINIFNIAKLTHGRSKDEQLARVTRLTEVLGQSYFDYLKSLPDLCIMMDESHHYHAEQSFAVINDLNPMLGVEFTATPQTQAGTKKVLFKNVVYEYSLAHALDDKLYVKEPAVWTRENFDPSQFTDDQLDREKLSDGVNLHIQTKAALDIYSRNYGERAVKPFILVVAKDITHSSTIKAFLTSADFNNGYYQDKVLEINSGTTGKVESDKNTELFLELENPDNPIEIVIHVNKLKEGWDVTNLYTIIPLRASASETLTEQTIGRGLRLPFGKRTGVDEVDRLSIVSHEKYSDVISLANSPDSLVRQVYVIDPSLAPDTSTAEMEPVELVPAFDTKMSSNSLTAEIASSLVIEGDTAPEAVNEMKTAVATFIAERTAEAVIGMSKNIKTFNQVQTNTEARAVIAKTVAREAEAKFNVPVPVEVIDKVISYATEALTGTVIPIPEVVINPQNLAVYRFNDFVLDTKTLPRFTPSSEDLIGQELSRDGQNLRFSNKLTLFKGLQDTAENGIAKYIHVKDDIIWDKVGTLVFTLIGHAKGHFLSYLNNEDTDKVMRQRAYTIADFIYAQMKQNFQQHDTVYEAYDIRPFSKIERSFASKPKSDEVYDYKTTVLAAGLTAKVFKGFQKACHNLYKFDSLPELEFARLLERESTVLKWLRPSPKQFNIFWGKYSQKYVPDYVVETTDTIFMVEVKASRHIQDTDVQEKGRAAMAFCETVSRWNTENEGKSWVYALVVADNINASSTLEYLITNKTAIEKLAGGDSES